jgi:hypothetical protein
MLEADENTMRLELSLSDQVNAPISDDTDVTKRVPDDGLESISRQLPMAEQFRAGRVSGAVAVAGWAGVADAASDRAVLWTGRRHGARVVGSALEG